MKIEKKYKGKLQSIIRGASNLLGENVKVYTKIARVVIGVRRIAELVSTAVRKDDVFKFAKGSQLASATMQGVPFVSLINYDVHTKPSSRFVHNIFGFGYIGYVTAVIKNGDIIRQLEHRVALDIVDSSLMVAAMDNGDMHVYDMDVVECDSTPDRKIIVNKVKIVRNGAKVIATYNRHINACHIKRGCMPKNNPNISQVLHSPKIYA